MHPAITDVSATENFSLVVRFEDGETGELDMTPYLGFGVFQALKDEKVFRQVHVAFDTIEWPGGIDLDPEFVRTHCVLSVRTDG
jgi:hypothetical protein